MKQRWRYQMPCMSPALSLLITYTYILSCCVEFIKYQILFHLNPFSRYLVKVIVPVKIQQVKIKMDLEIVRTRVLEDADLLELIHLYPI